VSGGGGGAAAVAVAVAAAEQRGEGHPSAGAGANGVAEEGGTQPCLLPPLLPPTNLALQSSPSAGLLRSLQNLSAVLTQRLCAQR